MQCQVYSRVKVQATATVQGQVVNPEVFQYFRRQHQPPGGAADCRLTQTDPACAQHQGASFHFKGALEFGIPGGIQNQGFSRQGGPRIKPNRTGIPDDGLTFQPDFVTG